MKKNELQPIPTVQLAEVTGGARLWQPHNERSKKRAAGTASH
jgi:hypothetical protein